MRILIIKTVPGEIKLKKVTYNMQEIGLARALIELGHQCDVMCIADNDEPSVQTLSVDDSKCITLYCMKAIKVLKNGFYSKDVYKIFSEYDILHASEYNQIFTWHIAKKFKDKMVCYHGPYYCDFNKRYNFMAKVFDIFFLNRYRRLNTQFITKSNLAADYLKKKGLKNVKAVGVGIDRKVLTSASDDRLDFVEEVNNHPEDKIMYIGKLEPRRNVFFLIDLLEEIRKREDVSLILVGTGEPEYVQKVFERIKEKGLEEHIIYREQIEQKYMQQLYSCAEVFVLPTFYDIYGMVLLEAMYFRQCVFTTVNGGSDMMIKNTENGFVFDNFDVKVWSNGIIDALRDENMRKDISAKAHETIEENFTWQKLSKEFVSLYKKKMGGIQVC